VNQPASTLRIRTKYSVKEMKEFSSYVKDIDPGNRWLVVKTHNKYIKECSTLLSWTTIFLLCGSYDFEWQQGRSAYRMQKIVEFSEMNFWSSQPSVEKLNVEIARLNEDGWTVINVVPNTGFGGRVGSYTLLVEREWDVLSMLVVLDCQGVLVESDEFLISAELDFLSKSG
jgi:hypothetical protein